ncbi:MAG TPA: HTTM domain-containing protein [Polyangiaceae bacterium]|nr:HTTM domain-containing protein [Polyangiaceae bacterium]
MSRARDLARRLVAWALLAEGSTRTAAILRLGLVLQLWCRWALDFTPFHTTSPDVRAIGASFFASSLLFFAGLKTRLAGAWLSLTLVAAYYHLGVRLGMHDEFSHHHTRLLATATCLVALAPSGRSLSADRYLENVRAAREGRAPSPERGPLWAQRLVALQVSVLYLFTAIDKTQPAFLNGTRLEQIYLHLYAGSDYPAWAGFHELAVAAAIATVALEYALAFGLWVPRWRRVLAPLGVAFHLVLYYCVPLRTFTASMCLLYLAFVDPDRVHAFIDTLLGRGDAPPGPAPGARAEAPPSP